MRDYAVKTLKRLVKFSKNRANKGIISRDAKNARRKIDRYLAMAQVSLEQLPDVQIECPSQEFCVQVDNTERINQYINAILLLKNQVIHTLNRATRLAYPTFQQAKIATAKFGKKVKKFGRDLVNRARELPAVRYRCDG